jgi:GTP-binding protein HflX
VRDISHEDTEAQSEDVEKILSDLGIEPHDPRIVEVWNKLDLLSEDRAQAMHNLAKRHGVLSFAVSAITGEGVDGLLDGIEARLSAGHKQMALTLTGSDGEGLSWLYANTQIILREDTPDGDIELVLKVAPTLLERFHRKFVDAQEMVDARPPQNAA